MGMLRLSPTPRPERALSRSTAALCSLLSLPFSEPRYEPERNEIPFEHGPTVLWRRTAKTSASCGGRDSTWAKRGGRIYGHDGIRLQNGTADSVIIQGLRAPAGCRSRQVRRPRHPCPCLRWWSHFPDLVRCLTPVVATTSSTRWFPAPGARPRRNPGSAEGPQEC